MKIILIAPPANLSDRYSIKLKDSRGYLPSLGILQIAAVLEEAGHTVKILDLPVLNYSLTEIKRTVKKFTPDIIGFSALTFNASRTLKIAGEIDKISKAPILFGGPHATVFPKATLENKTFIDFVVMGEGEETTLELLQTIEKKSNFKKVKGICFRDKNGRVIINPTRPPIKNLDRLPFPSYHLVDLKKYIPLPNQYKRLPAINIVTGRGCPWGKCTYCFESARLGYFRRISPSRTIELIKTLIKNYGIKEISFWDDMFIVGEKWINEFCDLINKKNIDITWSCYSRVDMVNPAILKKMSSAGCWNVFYGIESGNQELLDKIQKGTTLEQCRKAIKWTKEAGIESRGALMIALPGETPKKAENTIKFAIELDLDYAQFTYTTPYYGTKLFDQCLTEGRLDTNFNRYSAFEPVFVPSGYKDANQVKATLKRAYAKFYLRPAYFLKKVKGIRSMDDVKRLFYGFRIFLGFSR